MWIALSACSGGSSETIERPIEGSSSSRKSVRKSTVIVSKTALATVPARPSAALAVAGSRSGRVCDCLRSLLEHVVALVEILEQPRLLGLVEVLG